MEKGKIFVERATGGARFFVGGSCPPPWLRPCLGRKHDSNFDKLRMKKSRFVLKKKGFIFSAIVKGKGSADSRSLRTSLGPIS